MSNRDECNGWRNHETNMIAGQITNDPEQRYARIAAVLLAGTGTPEQNWIALAHTLRDRFNIEAEEVQGFNGDLARAALARVDWKVLAEYMLAEAAINPLIERRGIAAR